MFHADYSDTNKVPSEWSQSLQISRGCKAEKEPLKVTKARSPRGEAADPQGNTAEVSVLLWQPSMLASHSDWIIPEWGLSLSFPYEAL